MHRGQGNSNAPVPLLLATGVRRFRPTAAALSCGRQSLSCGRQPSLGVRSQSLSCGQQPAPGGQKRLYCFFGRTDSFPADGWQGESVQPTISTRGAYLHAVRAASRCETARPERKKMPLLYCVPNFTEGFENGEINCCGAEKPFFYQAYSRRTESETKENKNKEKKEKYRTNIKHRKNKLKTDSRIDMRKKTSRQT